MGGRSVKCKWCSKWFEATYVPLDHVKAKHPEKLEEARTERQWCPSVRLRDYYNEKDPLE